MRPAGTERIPLRDQRWAAKVKDYLPWLRPRPYTGKLWLDAIYVLMVGICQMAIVPTLLPGHMTVDLLTPWLIIGFVRGSLSRSLVTAVLAAVLIETYSAVPAGFYICTYVVIAITLYLVRGSLSWRVSLPWFASFLGSQVAVIGFEAFVIYLAGLEETMTPVYLLVQAARLILSTTFGMYLVDKRYCPEEPV